MPCPLYRVDAFTNTPFGGNPAAVCLLESEASTEWMQRVAAEFNAPASAFLTPSAGGYALRWFTTSGELTLCGHGTLAAAHVLWESGRIEADEEARFQTTAGPLAATQRERWIEMDFPSKPASPVPAPDGLREALGAEPVYVGRNELDCLVELRDEAGVRSLSPNMALMRALGHRGTIVTSRSESPGYDMVSRFFAPRIGIDEDSATGSAHCCLGPYWSAKLGKSELSAFQASARGAVLRVRVAGSRTFLSGQAVTIARGALTC